MITITTHRFDRYGNVMPNGGPMAVVEKEPDDALISLVRFELGFGGKPTALTERSIKIRTRVFEKTDIVDFEGPEEEMKLLLKAVSIWASLMMQHRGENSIDMLVFEKVFGGQGSALEVTKILPVIAGGVGAKQVMLYMVGQNNESWAKWLMDNGRLIGREEDAFYKVARFALRAGPEWQSWFEGFFGTYERMSESDQKDLLSLIASGDEDFATPALVDEFIAVNWPYLAQA